MIACNHYLCNDPALHHLGAVRREIGCRRPWTSRRRDERIPAPERREAIKVAVGREKFAHAVPDADRGYAGIVNDGPLHVSVEQVGSVPACSQERGIPDAFALDDIRQALAYAAWRSEEQEVAVDPD